MILLGMHLLPTISMRSKFWLPVWQRSGRYLIIPTFWVFLRKRCLIFRKPFQHLRPLHMVNFINRNPKTNLSLHSCSETHMPMQCLQWAARFYLLTGRMLHRYSEVRSPGSCASTYRSFATFYYTSSQENCKHSFLLCSRTT